MWIRARWDFTRRPPELFHMPCCKRTVQTCNSNSIGYNVLHGIPVFVIQQRFIFLNNCWLPLLVASFHLCCSCTVVWVWCGMSFCCHWNKQLRVLHLSWSVFQSQCCNSTLKRVFSAPLLPLFFCEWVRHPKPYSPSSSLVVAVMCFWNTNYIVSQNPDFSSSCSLISQQYCTDLLPSTQAEHQPARANSVEIMFIIIIWSDIWFKHT